MKYIKYQILAGKSKIRALGPINVNLALMSTLRLIINYTSTITNTKKYREEGRNLIYEFKLGNPCTSCGETNPIVLEFHHLDPKTKRNDVSNMATHGYSIESIEKEIEKCIILCANCHRKKTAKQQNWHSHKLRERSK